MKKGSLFFVCIVLMICFSAWIPDTNAYERYNDGCQTCHGPFVDNPIILTIGDKHVIHEQMVSGQCDVCHSSGDGNNPYLGRSNGIPGLPGVGCIGCHGRDYGLSVTAVSGIGLRVFHDLNVSNNAVPCSTCHIDTEPPHPESILPVYYGGPGIQITNSCNTDGSEDRDYDGIGLDNDGDGLYDGADPDCFVRLCFINEDCVSPTNPSYPEYCKKAVGDCDGQGTCQPIPTDPCLAVIDPVCGCDGVTYNNECEANKAGVNVDYYGPCTQACPDSDADGYVICSGTCDPSGKLCGDCDDNNPLINPGAIEDCIDTVDNDCDGLTDCYDGDCAAHPICIVCTDDDGDGYAVEGDTCGPIDCNDADPAINPGEIEICDGKDNDCNTATVDGSGESWYGNPTSCGLGICGSSGQLICANGSQYDTCIPDVPEAEREKGKTCKDGLDNDCDGSTDAADPDCKNKGKK